MTKLYGVIILFVVVIVISLFMPRKLRETFASRGITFMTSTETAAFLREDADGYVQAFTETDLYARKASSASEYIERAAAASASVSDKHKTRIAQLTQDVDAHLTRLGLTKMAEIPWVFAFTQGDVYENGYPHTRRNVVFLSTYELDRIDLGRTLLHEKVHVYQRMYPMDMQQYLQDNQYQRHKQRRSVPMARANPDLDDWIYIDPTTGKPMIAIYTSKKPSSISDVMLENPSFEHPYEKMAYDIANKYVT